MKENSPTEQKTNYRPIVLIVLIVLGIAVIALLQIKDDTFNLSGTPRLGKGLPAPEFSLPDLDGEMVSLADYKGKVVLLNIWATWCPPCVEEMPSMERLHRAMKNEDFEILAVSIDASGAATVRSFMEQHKLTFTALTDPRGTLKSLYQTTGVPESFIIDKNGMIAEKVIGPRNWATPGAIRGFQALVKKD